MARKTKAQDAPAKDGPYFVTYVGPQGAVSYMGQSFRAGVPVEVAESDVPVYACRSFFEVSRGDVLAG